jgi:formylglycine-generating enzyme required for sulfatase activity
MSVTGSLAAFTLKSAFNTSVDQLLGWLGARFSNPSQPLQRALMRANDHAWKATGLGLAGEELFDRIKPWYPDRDLGPFRDQVRGFLTNTPNGFSTAAAGVRLQASVELGRMRKAGRLTLLVDRNIMLLDLWRCGDPGRFVQGIEQVIASTSDMLAMEAPNLSKMIRLAPPDRIPLLAAAFLYFFRRESEINPDLARGLTFDAIRAHTINSERGIAFLEVPVFNILEHFDMVFDPLADWFGRAVHEVGNLRKELREWRDSHQVVPAALDAPLVVTLSGERERLLSFHARLRHLPPALVEASDWQNLGDNLVACGLFKEARASHTAAVAQAHADFDAVAEAENYFRIFKDACEGSKWPEAKEALLRATKLDSARFRLFDTARYQLDAVLGVSAFGVTFRCLDTEDLDEQGNPQPVVIKSLRYDILDRDSRAVFAEARILRDIARPSNHILRVLNWGYARNEPDQPARKERPYLVLEYFPAETLDVVVRRYGPMPVPVFLPVAIQIAKALKAAHAKGLCHRDVTPANVLALVRETTWDVRVIDFGLAAPHEAVYHASLNLAAKRSTARDRSLTRSLEFASPEQRGKLADVAVGPYSDVYAFGKTCLWLLFQTTLPQPQQWATLPPEAREPLQLLLEKATAEPLEARFPDFTPVLAALNAFFAPPPPPPPSAAPLAEAIEVPAAVETVQATAEPLPLPPMPDLEPQPVEPIEELEPVQELEPVEELEPVHELDAVEEPVHELEPSEPHPPEQTAYATPSQYIEPPQSFNESAASEQLSGPSASEEGATEKRPESQEKTRESSVKPKDPLHPDRVRSAGEIFSLKLPGNLPLKFAWCPPGTFLMGSTRDDANPDEKPTHTVTLTKGYFIGIYPVTQAQWKAALMPPNPSHFIDPERPVEQVLFEESQKFCRQLTRNLKGRGLVRLPTEAEWEYACRAGTSTEFNTGDGEESLQKAGWYEANSGKETHPVGQLAPNAWGIYDMHGNVWEWCGGWYTEYTIDDQTDPVGPDTGSDRVFRGGGWGDAAKFCRSTYRSWFDPAVRYDALGFRIVLIPGG